MNGMIIGPVTRTKKGIWDIRDVALNTNGLLLKGTVLDSLDSLSGWTYENSSMSLNTGNYLYGSSSISVAKRTTSAAHEVTRKAISSINLTGKTVGICIYIQNADVISRLSGLDIKIGSTSNGTNYKVLSIPAASLHPGWRGYESPLSSWGSSGTPNLNALICIQIVPVTTGNAVQTSANECLFDYWYYY
jgi:hypothetical protein